MSVSLGWVPDLPDFRDLSPDNSDHDLGGGVTLNAALQQLKMEEGDQPLAAPLGARKDLRDRCSPIENQLSIGSCTANAGIGLLEYFEIRAHNRHLDGSRLFLYKATRNLLGWQEDTGAFLRTTMGAMRLFGVPPEEYWPYTDEDPDWNAEPPAFLYSFAQNFQAMRYFRLDPPGTTREALLARIKRYIDANYPSMFGFTVYRSISQARDTGTIPFPSGRDSRAGGHAVCVVGYDDDKVIVNRSDGRERQGALIIRNSWGEGWGESGYGYLPYEYVLAGLAVDFWSLIRAEWVDMEAFGL